jgi:TrmH family RNA methyltransferase
MLEQVRIVMVATSHPGNIGAAARAMKTMGLHHLRLVSPRQFPHAEAVAMAAGADDILERAQVYPDLDAAIADCAWVCGSSARLRSLAWPVLDPRECARQAQLKAADQPVALVFGRERTGLTNEELARCHCLVNIPTNPDYASLNVASAVQVLAYELRMAMLAAPSPRPPAEQPLATAAEMAHFYSHLEEVLIDIGFLDPQNPRQLLPRLRRLFNRALPDRNEIHILRGILSAVQGSKSRRRT